jgi:hypothetical protein
MNQATPDSLIQASIEAARQRTIVFLEGLQAPGLPRGVMRISPVHDPVRWPGVLLPGSYNGVMALDLIGGLDGYCADERTDLADWLLHSRRPDGIFRIDGMADGDVFKKPDAVETWGYIDFHVTNYSLGAVQAVTPDSRPVLDFVQPWLDPLRLEAWLSRRDLRDPWQEGNNIVNLGSFLLLVAAHGSAGEQQSARHALDLMFAWHDRLQEPSTGFWGVGQSADPVRLLHAMAGSMHNFHLWYATGRPLPNQERAIDYALSRAPTVDSACIDVDLVDLLIHGAMMTGHRRDDTRRWLRDLLPGLIAFQNPDGGFPDVHEGLRRQDGWVRGYEEPQGVSNTFATWFRWIAIAMIADHLWPGWRTWRFRRMVGIGYRRDPAP